MSGLVEVISPDGQAGTIPAENLSAALAEGFKKAVRVTNPEGVEGSLPEENLSAALADGFKLGHASVPTPEGLQGPPRATPTPVTQTPEVGMALGAAKAVGHVGQTYARAYTGILKGALDGLTGQVSDWWNDQQ